MKRSFGHEDAGLATSETLAKIVENNAIREFLRTQDKRYVVGPKGSGKTLLLLRKAIDQRSKSNSICIPSDASTPVDRLTAAQHVGKQFNFSVSDESDANIAWASVWKNAIYRSAIHHLRDALLEEIPKEHSDEHASSWKREVDQARFRSAKKLIDKHVSDTTPFPRGPYHYYTEIGARMDAARRGGLEILSQENLELEALLQMVSEPLYIFLDNLDDYYEREPELWFNSMYGQFRAVRELALTHRHIHVFTSIRRDVYAQFTDEMRLQYYDYVTLLVYSKDEIRRIFENHIKELHDDLLMHPRDRGSDPWFSFFGNSMTISNGFVGVEEHVWDYIHRHTLGRPRDIIHVGTVLLERRPDEGFTAQLVRDAVASAEVDIAEQYLAEVRPMLDPLFSIRDFVKNHLTCNVLTPEDIEDIRESFIIFESDKIFDIDAPSDFTRPFETLYLLGLLGIVRQRPDSSELVQSFQPPGHGLPDTAGRELPASPFYLLHPVLYHWLPLENRTGQLVVGNDLPFVMA